MQVFLVEEVEKASFFKKIVKKVEVCEDKVLLNFDCRNLKFGQKVKAVGSIKNLLEKNRVYKLIVSKKLKEDKDFVDLLYSNGIDIVNGKILFKFLIKEILNNICIKNNIRCEEMQISVAVNDVNSFVIDLVQELAKKFKTLNVVTNHVNYFKRVKENLWSDNGIVILLTNNKKKALAKADIILNIDFPEELINQFVIYDNSILVNLEESVKIRKKRFCGKIINDYNIKLKKGSNIEKCLEKEEYKNFDLKDLAEVYLMSNPKEMEDIIIL